MNNGNKLSNIPSEDSVPRVPFDCLWTVPEVLTGTIVVNTIMVLDIMTASSSFVIFGLNSHSSPAT